MLRVLDLGDCIRPFPVSFILVGFSRSIVAGITSSGRYGCVSFEGWKSCVLVRVGIAVQV